MSLDSATEYLKQFGVEDRIQVFDVSSATVDLAAQAVGVEGARIAKTLSFKGKEHPMLVVATGDARVDNKKFKSEFGLKASMQKGTINHIYNFRRKSWKYLKQ